MVQNRQISLALLVMTVLFCVCLITSNLLEAKLFRIFGCITLTGGFLVFPISYIINDCIAEVWGFAKARLVIWLGFATNFLVMALGGLACALPSADVAIDSAFDMVFAFAPQVVVASLLAFVAGSFFNALIMSKMKLRARDKSGWKLRFSLRAIWSTVVGETVDSLIFFPLAFYIFPSIFSGGPIVGWLTLGQIMAVQILAKTLYEVLALPLTIRVVRYVKRHEGTDAYDDQISYNIFRVKDL